MLIKKLHILKVSTLAKPLDTKEVTPTKFHFLSSVVSVGWA